MELSEVTEKIIGAAYDVHNAMGFGYLESVYENSLLVELRERGLGVESQHPIEVQYKGRIVGNFVADLVVNGSVLVELKSVRQLAMGHETQLVNYLVATGKPVGLLINFGPARVDIKRKVPVLPEP